MVWILTQRNFKISRIFVRYFLNIKKWISISTFSQEILKFTIFSTFYLLTPSSSKCVFGLGFANIDLHQLNFIRIDFDQK